MPKCKFIFWPLLSLLAASLACGGSATPSATPDSNAVATIVAATLSAIEPQSSTAAPTPSATPNPSEAALPTASPTPEMASAALQVAYLDAGNLWLWQTDGSRVQLTSAGNARLLHISGDGSRIAYLQAAGLDEHELWVVNRDGSDNRRLISASDLGAMPRAADALATQIFQLAWVPNTQTLAYNTRPVYEGPGLSGNNDLRLVDADSGEHRLLLSAGQGGMFHYAPDGSQIAVVTPETLSLVNADGSGRRDLLTFPFVYTYSEWAFYPTPVWAPDSTYLRVAIPPQDPLANPGALTLIWHLPADGSMPYLAGEVVAVPAFLSSVLLSPDTRRAIYLYPPGEAFDHLELHILDLDTARDMLYHAGPINLVNWNPDSTRFIFSQGSDGQPYLGWQGSLPAALPGGTPAVVGIEWVDAERFLFSRGRFNAWELVLNNLAGASIGIASPVAEFIEFDFSPKP